MPTASPLFFVFDRLMRLSKPEAQALRDIPFRTATIPARQDVVRAGERLRRCVVVLSGLLASSKVTSAGVRQIEALHIAGDAADLSSIHLDFADSDIRTLVDSQVAFVEHDAIRRLCDEHPRLAAALWKRTLIDAAIVREWVINIGGRPAESRLAHLFCEMLVRMNAVSASTGNRCAFPVTQSDLSEAVGMSVVHVNRLLQHLRAKQLISFVNGYLMILDWDAMCELGGFDPSYLHLTPAKQLGFVS